MATALPSVPVNTGDTPATWIVIGASRGIGLEFVSQLLTTNVSTLRSTNGVKGNGGSKRLSQDPSQETQVIAVVRNPTTSANQLWQITAQQTRPGRCLIEACDVSKVEDIEAFALRMKRLVDRGLRIEGIILNAGVLHYPNRATELSFQNFAQHLQTNTIGPIIIAQKLLDITAAHPPSKVVFMSSDSGSTTKFLEYEDGFAAYGASKAALNQMLRHMAAELKRRGPGWEEVCVLAMHPGEVKTDMQNIDIAWDVEGLITPEESVRGMLAVIASKGKADSGTFWCWDGREHPW